MIKKGYLYLVVILFIACNSESNVEFKAEKLEKIRTLKVQIPSDYQKPIIQEWHASMQNGKDFLLTHAIEGSFFKIFPMNINDGKYESTIKIPMEGPDGINSASAQYFLHNEDSIFLFPTSRKHIYLYNSAGKKVKTYYLNSDLYLSFKSYVDQQVFAFTDNKLILNAIPYDKPTRKNFTRETTTFYEFDLVEEQLAEIGKYPSYTYGKILPSLFLGGQHLNVLNKFLLTNYYFADSIYVRHVANLKEAPKAKFAGIPLKHLQGLDKPIDNMSAEGIYLQLENPRYLNILYDTYRKKIYRIVEHKQFKYKNLKGQELYERILDNQGNNDEVITRTLIVLNENLEVEGYYSLPLCNIYLPTVDGLLTCSYEEGETENFFDILGLD